MKITQEAEKVVDVLCLMDDTLFRVVAQDKGFCEEVLRVILQKEDLKVITVRVQKNLHHIHSHSVVFDVLCKDSHNKNYNIEVQQEDNDDHQRRVRYHAASVDTTMLEKGKKYADLPDLCVVYVSSFDIFKKGKTTYHVDRTLRETKDVVDNGLYEVYVNTQIDDSTSTAALMKVFKSTTPVQDDRFQRVCEKLKEYKEGKGRSTMCKLVEDYANMRVVEEAQKEAKETARRAFAMGLPIESVAQLVKLSGEELERIAAEVDIA